MPARPPENDFVIDNSPSRVQGTEKNEATQTVRNFCRNHPYRRRTRRMGQVASYCALCMDQQEMAARWKKIRKALATIRCSRLFGAAKATSVPAAKTYWEVAIVRTAIPPTAIEGMRLLVVIT